MGGFYMIYMLGYQQCCGNAEPVWYFYYHVHYMYLLQKKQSPQPYHYYNVNYIATNTGMEMLNCTLHCGPKFSRQLLYWSTWTVLGYVMAVRGPWTSRWTGYHWQSTWKSWRRLWHSLPSNTAVVDFCNWRSGMSRFMWLCCVHKISPKGKRKKKKQCVVWYVV